MIKKNIKYLILAATLLLSGCNTTTTISENTINNTVEEQHETSNFYKSENTSYKFRTCNNKYQIYNGQCFEDIYFTGVNIGTGEPNAFPGEFKITKDEYKEWLTQISEMGANCVRVYTVLSPDFYQAFYEYNNESNNKLYLFQGVWYEETVINNSKDAYSAIDFVKSDLKNLVDIIHGNASIEEKTGHASGTYLYDISNYVAGWMLGIEPDAEMVITTNNENKDKTSYLGEYLYCNNVQPYETMWCEIGDYVLEYEDSVYSLQRPISFINWPTADILSHPNEPDETEDMVNLNVEDIQIGENNKTGLYACYHIYPYYPSFFFYENAYANYIDDNGQSNTYKAYLEDLIKIHNVPVIVSEFGVPTSRGITHTNPVTNYNQGHITEEQQGKMIVSMMKDIEDSGYSGAIIFSWQDEWFKRTWNTMEHTDSYRRAYWSDAQTCEQHFGLLEFISGGTDVTCKIDGNKTDWQESDLLFTDKNNNKYYVKEDAAYLYIMIDSNNINYEDGNTQIYFDITPLSGSSEYNGNLLGTEADFILEIMGTQGTRLKVHNYYDHYAYLYGKKDNEIDLNSINKNSTQFNKIYLITDKMQYLPEDNVLIPLKKEETGLMTFGISDVDSNEYNSLADFYYKDNIFEIRIPWGLLQFMDPSTKEIENDFWEVNELSGINIEDIKIGAIINNEDQGYEKYTWDNWDKVFYHTRLKKSYYIIKDYLTNK